jgi:hypothetical protein
VGAGLPARLVVETELYETHRAEWLECHRNQFVVVKGNDLLGFFIEFQDAYYAGVEKYGFNTDFLVKRVVQQEPISAVF